MSNEELLVNAYSAMDMAYAPYSNFKVGAVVETIDSNIYTGCNIENVSYGATVCAERCAIFKAVSEGHLKIKKIAIVCSEHQFAMPCGICRQVMCEFMDNDSTIIVTDDNQIKELKLSDIMPESFSM